MADHDAQRDRPEEDLPDTREAPQPSLGGVLGRYPGPLRLLITTAIAIFLAEIFVVLLIDRLGPDTLLAQAMVSAAVIAVVVVPMLYTALFRPMIRHIVSRHQLERTLRELAIVDEMTDIFNRRGFNALSEQRLKIAKRLKKGLSILFMDMDNLKGINDRLGHAAGDRALVEMAGLLRECFRESDVIARFGGDEFIVLTLETGSRAGDKLVGRIYDKVAERNAKGSGDFELQLSIGAARCGADEECSVADMVARADKAMYAEKRRRRASA